MEPVTKGARQFLDVMQRVLLDLETVKVKWRPSDLLVLDNHRCLHGRGESAEPDPDRVLEGIARLSVESSGSRVTHSTTPFSV